MEDQAVSVDDIDIESRADSPEEPSKRLGSGLTLVLPSLKSLQQGKRSTKKKSKSKPFGGYEDVQSKRPPRPAKLKPLKEVLTKLIANIKKKDDYGFFLAPVNVDQVPGYAAVVKQPMDLGTITIKVAKGRYRSLQDFTNDIRLVTSNAKIFNPPGTIYHTEAEKLETWALDHIEKASATVIQYETDWNLDTEKAESDAEEDIPSTPAVEVGTPEPSEPQLYSGIRRSTRAPYKKVAPTNNTTQNGLSESLETDGRLPGSKDGLGAFPPSSDLAKTMLDLKLKGKRYKTKKERMRIEKEGPPFRSDGSLDVYNMEDPFSMFSGLVPAPLTRPLLMPVYPPTISTSQPQSDPSQPVHDVHDISQSQTPQPSSSFLIPTFLPLNRPLPEPELPKGRHWIVSRNSTYRRGKDKEDEGDENDSDWKIPREPHATDFGSFALLAGELAEELKRRGISGDIEQKTMEIIKDSLDCGPTQPLSDSTSSWYTVPSTLGDSSYWNATRAAEAESYIRDVVYGGVEGLAYVRSLAEFVAPPEETDSCPDQETALGMPLAKWVETNIVDPLTGHRHSILRDVARQISVPLDNRQDQKSLGSITPQLSRSLHVYPQAFEALQILQQLRSHTIDMGSLIRKPDEIYQSEKEWYGKVESMTEQIKKEEDSMEIDSPHPTAPSAPNGKPTQLTSNVEQLNRVFSYVADTIIALDKRRHAEVDGKVRPAQDGSNVSEDPTLRNIRLNLLALAKRAPLDTIALLPRELVPEQIRHVIPTLPATPTQVDSS